MKDINIVQISLVVLQLVWQQKSEGCKLVMLNGNRITGFKASNWIGKVRNW